MLRDWLDEWDRGFEEAGGYAGLRSPAQTFTPALWRRLLDRAAGLQDTGYIGYEAGGVCVKEFARDVADPASITTLPIGNPDLQQRLNAWQDRLDASQRRWREIMLSLRMPQTWDGSDKQIRWAVSIWERVAETIGVDLGDAEDLLGLIDQQIATAPLTDDQRALVRQHRHLIQRKLDMVKRGMQCGRSRLWIDAELACRVQRNYPAEDHAVWGYVLASIDPQWWRDEASLRQRFALLW